MNHSLTQIMRLQKRGVISIFGAGGKTSLMFHLAKSLAEEGKTVLTTTTTKFFLPDFHQSPATVITPDLSDFIRVAGGHLDRYSHFSAGRKLDPATKKIHGFDPGWLAALWQKGLFDWIIVEADGAAQKPLKSTAAHEPVLTDLTTRLILVVGLDAVGCCLDDTTVHRASLFSKRTGLPLGGLIDEAALAKSCAFEMQKAGQVCRGAHRYLFLNKADTPSMQAGGRKTAGYLKSIQLFDRMIVASLKDQAPVKQVIDNNHGSSAPSIYSTAMNERKRRISHVDQ